MTTRRLHRVPGGDGTGRISFTFTPTGGKGNCRREQNDDELAALRR